MTKKTIPSGEIVAFLQRDYKMIRELGRGACGLTVLLHDPQIDEHFVCKKYLPHSEEDRKELFDGFKREVKLLHRVFHHNVVRVFTYYLYPNELTGYILMEHVDGFEIDDHVKQNPEHTNDLFLQAVAGFAYLERAGILHRDVRPGNLMVRQDGVLKIIDLGFGKKIERTADFDKSISLNSWCEPPLEFQASHYDFATEVYFVGRLFQRLIQENQVTRFKYMDTLATMCHRDPDLRIANFSAVEQRTRNKQFFEADFGDPELQIYRRFANAICYQITKIENGAKYVTDVDKLRTQLNDAYQRVMLEESVPDAGLILRPLINGPFYYRRQGLDVNTVRDFLQLLRSTLDERAKIILANLHTRLDSLPRYDKNPFTPMTDDDIPF